MSAISTFADGIFSSMGLDFSTIRPTTLSLSLKPAPKAWKAHTFEAFFPVYRIEAREAKIGDIRNFLTGIRTDNFVVLVELSDLTLLCMSRAKKGEAALILPIRTTDDYERTVNVLKRHNFRTDELSAHVAIDSCIELLKSGAEKYFINRGLFSTYFLRERLDNALVQRKRDVKNEGSLFFSKFQSGIPSTYEETPKVLDALGYSVVKDGEIYQLSTKLGIINAAAIVVKDENLDVKSTHNNPVPSIQAVAALTRYPWVILTNGKVWRLYSSRVSSASTNYFEINIDDITDEKHPKLNYFISLFGSHALTTGQDGINDLDFIYNGGLSYAKELEDDLRIKVFEKQLFLDLVKGIISHSKSGRYSEGQLQVAKKTALKLLYRIFFILYAESRSLLPVSHTKYKEISFSSLRERLASMEKEPESTQTWEVLMKLFKSISNGSPEANVPQYNGALFEIDESLDSLKIKNKYLVSALKELTLIEGKGIDYQNFGVRQLGSLYESLLDYGVKQAESDLVVIKDEILDFSFALDLKNKPSRIIEKGDLYLSAGGLARKGTGSYYTPEKIVKFLVQKGLGPIFNDREKKFMEAIEKWRKTRTESDASLSTKQLLDIQVVDPAMGSGHFLVVTVDEITKWIMSLLKRYPDAPLAEEIGKDREKILSEQNKLGIVLDEELLSFNVILKRKVMKRCVFGVDVNPLAVELAKLSLWLDSFTIGTPLTFLDHHIRCGDSLIGLWMENLKATKAGNLSLDFWTDSVERMGDALHKICIPVDLTLAEFKTNKETYKEFREKSKPLRILLDMRAAAIIDSKLQASLPMDLSLVEETVKKNKLNRVTWSKPILESISYSEKYLFFHWELEFPDAYTDERRGFDLVVMNPPWDAVRPYDDDFFSQHNPSFRRISTKTEKSQQKTKLLKQASIASSYFSYINSIQERLMFFKLSNQYKKRSSKGIAFDLWALFVERGLQLLTQGGTLSILLPSGIVNNEGATNLRKLLLKRRIMHFYEFENKNAIFQDIHKSYKFLLLVVENLESNSHFHAAFYLNDLSSLNGNAENEKFINLTSKFVEMVSPMTLSIPELRSSKDILIFSKLYQAHPLISSNFNNGIKLKIMRELNRTESASLFTNDGKGWPVIEGKNIHQFIIDYEKPAFTIPANSGLRQTSKISNYVRLNKEIHEVCRLVFRDVAASTNVRTAIACIIPKHTFATNTAPLIFPTMNDKIVLDDKYYQTIAYVVGILNSMTFDYLIRRRITMHLNFFYLEQTPIPTNMYNEFGNEITRVSARLSCLDRRFEDLANSASVEYGHLSIKDRIDLTARLDATVALQYGLDREEYDYIINTFDAFENVENFARQNVTSWNDAIIRKLNGEVRKNVLGYFDSISSKNNDAN